MTGLPGSDTALRLVGVLLGCLAVAAASQTGVAHARPPVEAAPTVTPTPPASTPTPSPPDADLAVTLARQGESEAAIAAYLAVIDQGTAEQRLAARLGLARLYLDDGQATQAARQLDAYLLEAPAGTDVRASQYLLAEALSLQGDWDQALPLYDAYVQAGGGEAIYARLDRAEALAHLGRLSEAASEGERLLDEELPRSARLAFILTMAQTLEAWQPQDALVWYDRLRREGEAPADQALALWRSASIRRDLGDDGPRREAWTTIVQRFPETATAQAIVDEPPRLAAPLDSYYIGLVYYQGGREREAREAFEVSLESNRKGPDRSLAARSSYYLAVLDERTGDVDQALEGYRRVLDLDPMVELADDALWWRARLLERADRVGEAVTDYQRLLSDYGGSDWALEARFRLPLLAYDRGDWEEAAKGFAAIAGGAEGGERRRALLWQGKALATVGDESAAEAAWRTLREEAPDDYYGLRAAVLLGDAQGSMRDAGLGGEGDPDWAAVEEWLFATGGASPWSALEILLHDRHWRLAQELQALGMSGRAGDEFALVVEAADGKRFALYKLARHFRSVGMPQLSSQAAARLLRTYPEQAAEDAPSDLWRLAYPAPFLEVLCEAADEADVPDLLLLALIRQESFFNPRAGSPAGARGLTQVMAETGEAIARDLAWPDFEVDDLYRPSVSLRFGAHYLAEQLDLFGGEFYYALAAYNGGPGNAFRWRSAAGNDVDRFVAEIEFSETQTYVRLVTENLARYRQLYEGLEEPVLPED